MNEVIEILKNQFVFDIQVMSQPWMYWALLVPISFYLVFFVIKWIVLTCPVWIPINIVISHLKKQCD